MDRNQERFLRKLDELANEVEAGLRRRAERSVDVLASMARGHRNPRIREQLTGIVDAMKERVAAMPPPAGQRREKKSMSVRTVSGGLPTLRKRRR